MDKKLNIGFILHGDFLPIWYAETISSCMKEIDGNNLFIRLPNSEDKASFPLLYKAFLQFEERWFHPAYDAQKLVTVDEIIGSNQSVRFHPVEGYVLEGRDVDELKTFELDLLYTIGFDASINENLSQAARLGLWYVQFGFDAYRNTATPAFWEVMDNAPVAGSYLLMRKDGKDFILYEGTTITVPFSVKNTFNAIAWKSSSYFVHRARTLAELPDHFSKRFGGLFVPATQKRTLPGNFQMAFLFARNIKRYLAYKRKLKSGKERFTLLHAQQPFSIATFHKAEFKSLKLPNGVFYADPFVIHHNGINYVFFEEYRYDKQKAHISVIEINQNGKVTTPRLILEKPYHLSYPFVFKLEDEFYMIPETSANRTVELYRAVDFPGQWEFVMNLMDGKELIDCTLFFKDNKWWLFANQTNHPAVSTNDQLFLYYSESLFSPDWKSHPMNPVATHAANCRPAGRIFQMDGKIYRPSQNNASQQYGFGLNISEVEVLNTEEYRERLVVAVHPGQLDLKAIHHLDFSPSMIVVDGILKEESK